MDHFPFLDLPVEIRLQVYRAVFEHRTIILWDRWKPKRSHQRLIGRLTLVDGNSTVDSTISILQTCKLVFMEAQPLLAHYPPSHLVLSKHLRTTSSSPSWNESMSWKSQRPANLPLDRITRLTINVKSLGRHSTLRRPCPAKTRKLGEVGEALVTRHVGFGDVIDGDGLPLDPLRGATLDGLHRFLGIFQNSFPSLRELNIFDTLQHSLQGVLKCLCPLAGTTSCLCGLCRCSCGNEKALPQQKTWSIEEMRTELGKDLSMRYQKMLPTGAAYPIASAYASLICLLAHGVNIFFYDEADVTIRLGTTKVLHKGRWRARYHLAPPEGAAPALKPPRSIIESPRTRQLRERQKFEWLFDDGEVDSAAHVVDFKCPRRLEYAALPGTFPRKRSLKAYESPLGLWIVDESDFNRIKNRDVEGQAAPKSSGQHSDLWIWD